MSTVDDDESGALVARARELEGQAAKTGESTNAGRALLAEAARLRVQALGPRSYPVVICTGCLRVTGWAAAGGLCDGCLRSAQRQAAYVSSHGGFVMLGDNRPAAPPAEEGAGPGLLSWLFGGRGARDRALVDAWMKRVDPDVTGPVDPEEGFELDVAHRSEIEAADSSGMLVRFRTTTHRFTGGAWAALETTRIGSHDLLVPADYSAGLDTEALVAAWLDYRTEVDKLNQARWANESSAREGRRIAHSEHADVLRDQRDVLELLDES